MNIPLPLAVSGIHLLHLEIKGCDCNDSKRNLGETLLYPSRGAHARAKQLEGYKAGDQAERTGGRPTQELAGDQPKKWRGANPRELARTISQS